MSNYYSMRDAKVRIAHELMRLGWKVYGYYADESDSMTDYYSPAHWNGIATKNGFILVVDRDREGKQEEIKKYNPAGNLSFEDREKISKLENMTTEKGCTEGEEENAKKLIEKIQSKIQGKSAWEITGTIPAHMGNPGKCKWHIEKDGKMYDKGTGLTKYSDLPYEEHFDLVKMEFKPGCDYWHEWQDGERVRVKKTLTDEQKKLINDFKALILRFERIVNGMNSCGDGTKETEQEGIDNQKPGLKKVIEKVTKKVIKPIQKDNITINIGDVLSFPYHGHFWIVTDIYIAKEQKRISYELLGSAKRGYQRLTGSTLTDKRYYQPESKLIKELEAGTTKIHTLQEVEEVTEVEKWVRVKETKKTNNSIKANKQEKKEQPKQQQQQEQTETKQENSAIISYEYTITADKDTRDNSPLWVVKILDKLTKEEYINVSNQFKKIQGYYSKFKKGFIFRYDPTGKLSGDENGEENTSSYFTNKDVETAENILDKSTEVITELQLSSEEYPTNEDYKKAISEYLQKHNINITESILEYLEKEGFNRLAGILKAIKQEAEQQRQQEKQQVEKAVLLEKIEKNIDSLQAKIDKLSGDYKTNTYKRMNEQANRDNKINSFEIDIKLLEHVKWKLIDNITITALEKDLTVGAFRDQIHSYYNQKYGKYPREIEFPTYNHSAPADGWYNKEVPKMQNRLKKYGITNTAELIQAVEEYKIIYNSVNKYISLKDQQIKKLSNEYKLRQKGDVNFTPLTVAEQMIQYARIDNNSKVLEPSAGIGNIADKIKEVTENIDCIEWNHSFSELLKLKGHNVVANNFLEYNRPNYYDAVIMNPPFSNNQDITHLKHAYNLLKSDGTLVCITSPHWTFANDKASQEFRNWLEEKDYFTRELPSGTFEMTGVKSQIVVIEKKEETLEQAI